MENFLSGYNCAQAVTLAFSDLLPLKEDMLLKMSSPFGGGMGRLREVCGAVSGMMMVLGAIEGYADPKAKEEKADLYAKEQELAAAFREIYGSIVCRELLGLAEKVSVPVPEERTDAYYKKRPCKEQIGMCAAILEDYLKQEGHLLQNEINNLK